MPLLYEKDIEQVTNKKSAKVFISYAREDREIARRLYDDLQRAGLELWMDEEDLLPGQNWKREIPNAIRTSSRVLILLSSRSLTKSGYVQKEIQLVLDTLDAFPSGQIYLIPVRIDDCRPHDSKLMDLHWADIFPSYQRGLYKILRSLGVVPVPKAPTEAKIEARPDPYADFKPIHDPDWFYGRDKLMSRLPGILSEGQHVGVFGLRKVGKTSLIKQIQQRFLKTPNIFIDCQGFSPKSVVYFNEILSQLRNYLKINKIIDIIHDETVYDSDDFRNQFLELFELWLKFNQHEPFIIIFDEIDSFFPKKEVANSESILMEYVKFFKVLRALAQTHQCLVTVVISYRPNVNRYNLITPTVGENPMFASFHEEYLGFLTKEESTKMILEIGLWKYIYWDTEAAERVFYYCGGHPFITRHFASFTCNRGKLKKIDLNQVGKSAQEMIKSFYKNEIGNYYKESVWVLLNKDEQQVLSMLVQENEHLFDESEIPSELYEALSNLEHFGLVTNHQGKLCITSNLFYLWLKRRLGK
jgi:hypothetical protein